MRASDIRKGTAVIVDGKLFVVTGADHNTPGNLRAKVQFKLRDVLKGTIQDKRVGATDEEAIYDRTRARDVGAKGAEREDSLGDRRRGKVVCGQQRELTWPAHGRERRAQLRGALCEAGVPAPSAVAQTKRSATVETIPRRSRPRAGCSASRRATCRPSPTSRCSRGQTARASPASSGEFRRRRRRAAA